jgi:hypothetical protein
MTPGIQIEKRINLAGTAILKAAETGDVQVLF